MKSLYQIQKEYLELINEVEMNEGELSSELITELSINRSELEVKSIAYHEVIQQRESLNLRIDEELKRLQAIKKQNDKLVTRLKNNLTYAVLEYGNYEAGFLKFGTRKSTIVNVTIEANALPKEYKTVKVTEAPDKVAIKKALESGEAIEGCELVTNYNLTIK